MYYYTFNGASLSTFGAYLQSKNRQVSPARKVTYIEIPGRDGSYVSDNGAGDRVIVVRHHIARNTLVELRAAMRAVSAWLFTKDRAALIFDDEPDKYYRAKVDGAIDLEQIVYSGEFDVTFRCDPFAYAVTSKTSPFTDDAAEITNAGTVNCFPVFTITFTDPATELKITKGAEYVRIVKNFAAEDVLVVDNEKGTVKLNGGTIMASLDWQNSTFFGLEPGLNALTVTPTGKASVSSTIRERWL